MSTPEVLKKYLQTAPGLKLKEASCPGCYRGYWTSKPPALVKEFS